MRNNAAEPTQGHVIMFGTASAGWLVLFLINLTLYTPTAAWWAKAVFSGVLLVACLVFTILLAVRRGKAAKARRG